MGGSDIFVMPNVRVAGDVEGFGLVAIEAANAGLLVVASRLEGIVDAVIDGTTGYLCESLNADAWTGRLTDLLADPERAREAAGAFSLASRRLASFERMARDLPAALGISEADGPADELTSGGPPEEQQPS
jgi:glycosyltransferase involved in cell wall biosynthesis